MFNNDVLEVIKTYSGATKFHAFYIDGNDNTPCYLPQKLNYEALINYFDLKEILIFTETVFAKNSHYSSDTITYHTFQTKNNFIYNVIFVNKCQDIKGAIISGPILIYPPDEIRIEEILEYNKMPINNKPEIKEIIKNLPLASMEQIGNCGKLLLALCKSDIKSWASSQSKMHSQLKPEIETVFDNLIGTSVYDSEINIRYECLYSFIINLKETITQGKTTELSELLDKSVDILWFTGASKDIFSTLKIKCVVICSLSCIYAIQGKSPMELMINMLYEFIEKIEMLKTADEVVSYMMTIVRAYAHAVSVLTDNAYSMHVNHALQYIKKHYTEEITLETLANYAQIHPVYLSRLIKKETKLSLSDNINKIRIAQSRKLLIYTNKSLNEIAHTVGYNYQNHFSLMFKKYSGVAPIEFRKKYVQSHNTFI